MAGLALWGHSSTDEPFGGVRDRWKPLGLSSGEIGNTRPAARAAAAPGDRAFHAQG